MLRLLSVAGSDPSGGAGIQVDLKVFSALGAYGMAVPTALTVQNTCRVEEVFPLERDFVIRQLKAILNDIKVDGVKIGMLGRAELAADLARVIPEGVKVVFDPVIRATTGAELTKGAVELFYPLIERSDVVTPNVEELKVLSAKKNLNSAVEFFAERFPKTVFIVTGADEAKDVVEDLIFSSEFLRLFSHKKLKFDLKTHGTGCCFSSALLYYLCLGFNVFEAYEKAKDFVKISLFGAEPVGKGSLPVNPVFFVERELKKIKVLERLKQAFEFLKSIPGIYKLIPEVQMNLAEAVSFPLSVNDVAAFPGRIVKVKRSIAVVSPPEFGASSHVARIVLAANSFDRRILSAANIRFDSEWVKKLAEYFDVAGFSRKDEPPEVKEKEGSTLDWGVKTVCERLSRVPDIIYDEGDVGKEPMIRVLGRDSLDVVKKIRKIAEILGL